MPHPNSPRNRTARIALLVASVVWIGAASLAIGCRGDRKVPAGPVESGAADASPGTEARSTTNRIDIPPTVRKNLGITFARVEVRNVARTLRVPGRFELTPEARRECHAPAAGRVEIHVAQFAEVDEGTLLAALDSPEWRGLQRRLGEARLAIEEANAGAEAIITLSAAGEEHVGALESAVTLWTQRVEQLEANRASGAVSEAEIAQARATLVSTRASLAEATKQQAELRLREARLDAGVAAHAERFELLLAEAAALRSEPVSALREIDPQSPGRRARWQAAANIEIRAQAPGVVESLQVTDGAWVAEGGLILTTVQPDRLRFRATALQADLPGLVDRPSVLGVDRASVPGVGRASVPGTGEAGAQIAPPRTPGLDIGDAVPADVQLGIEAHPDNRTIELIATPSENRGWMRPGVSAFLEIVTDGSGGPALAVPRSAIVRDGTHHVLFRRDPQNPNQAIRIEADMGVDDGRWVVIHSGLTRGDEVVLDGVYELKLATEQSGASQQGGHFHADGSFHGEH